MKKYKKSLSDFDVPHPLLAKGSNMEEVHIGKKIREKLDEQGRGVKWFSDRLGCCRDNVYKIFQRKYIDTGLLLKISQVLDYDFFADYSEMINNNYKSKTDGPDGI